MVFVRLADLDKSDRPIMIQIVHGQHPLNKIAKRLLDMTGKNQVQFDLLPLARLVQTILNRCYGYWLQEDDPLAWFLDRCSIPVTDFHSSQLFHSFPMK